MAKNNKSDEQIKAEIHKKINERLDHIEAAIKENEELHAKRIQLKDWEIKRLEKRIERLMAKAGKK